MNYAIYIAVLLVAAVLLFGCAQAQSKTDTPGGSTPSDSSGKPGIGSGPSGASPAGDGGNAAPAADNSFGELDTFASADVEILDPDPGSEFVFDETKLQ